MDIARILFLIAMAVQSLAMTAAESIFDVPILQAIERSDPSMRFATSMYETSVLQELLLESTQFPRFSLTTESNLSQTWSPLDYHPTTIQDLSAAMEATQQLPWGGFASVRINQTQSFAIPAEKWLYSFSLAVAGSSPLFSPEKAWVAQKEISRWTTTQAKSLLRKVQRSRLSEVVGMLGTLALSRMDRAALVKREAILDEQAKVDEALWSQGKISFFELSDRDASRATTHSEKASVERDLLEVESLFLSTGLPSSWQPDDVEEFIRIWDLLASVTPEESESLSIAQAKLELETNEAIMEQMGMAPVLNWTFGLSPQSPFEGDPTPSGAISGYWSSSSHWNWNLGIKLSIPLSPWDPVYSFQKSTDLRVAKARAQYDQNVQDILRRGSVRSQVFRLLADALLEAERQEAVQQRRLDTVRALGSLGRETQISVALQEVLLDRAHLAVLKCRLSLVLARLGGQ